MVLQPTFDEELRKEDGKVRYKLRSVYTKNDLLFVKFETKYKVHKGCFKINRLMINPQTGREYFYEDIEKAVKQMEETKNKKEYVKTVSDKIDKNFEIELNN